MSEEVSKPNEAVAWIIFGLCVLYGGSLRYGREPFSCILDSGHCESLADKIPEFGSRFF